MATEPIDREVADRLMAVECPYCQAKVGEPCRSRRTGTRYPPEAATYGWHTDRRQAAGEAVVLGGKIVRAFGIKPGGS